MVKRNTNFKQMFLADDTLINGINSKLQSINNNTNNLSYIPYQNQSCVECNNSKGLEKLPFPEEIKDSKGNINATINDESTSHSESSSDDDGDNGGNNQNERMIQPSSYEENNDTHYNSLNQTNTQPQSNGEISYNSLNQRIIQPLHNYSPSSSGNESDTENPNRIQNFQNFNSRGEYTPQINKQSPIGNILPRPNINQDNPKAHIINSSQTEMDITNNRDRIRQQNEDLAGGEEQFTAPLHDEEFMDINVQNISQSRRSANKMKRLKNKIRMKKDDAQRKSKKVLNPIKDSRASKMHDEKALDEDEEMLSDIEEKHENIDDDERKKRNTNDILNVSRIKKQQKRKEKIKLLKLKQQRLKQLYLENKNQKMKHLQPDGEIDDSMDSIDDSIDKIEDSIDKIEDSIDNRSNANDDQPNDVSKSPATRLRKFAYGTLPQQKNLNKSDETFDLNEDNSKRPRIKVRKFAYGTMPEQENITKPEFRVAKFANQELIKDNRNLTNELQYFCELCKIQFPKYSSLRQHLQKNHEKKQYKIDFPNAGKYLALARKVKHKDDGSKFFYQNFNSNNEATTDLTSYWCSKCQKFFKNFQSMQSHMLEHKEGETTAKRSNTRERMPKPNKKMFYEAY